MRKLLLCLLFCGGAIMSAEAQFEWPEKITELEPRRFDDFFFLNNQKGWAVTNTVNLRKVYRTVDGGNNWTVMRGWNEGQIGYLRSVRFFNDTVGVLGTLGGGFYRSTNGGTTWDTIQQLLNPRPTAICGMFRVNDSVLYAVGDYAVGAKAYRTRDRGLSWTYLGNIPQALSLIDAYFFDEQHGFMTGRANPADSGAVLLYTADGGQSWEVKGKSGRAADLGWKIFFQPDQLTGYMTVQARQVPVHYFFKTTDGGQNWVKKTIPIGGDSVWFIQGMGFTQEGVGWAGGHFPYGYIRTFDGGETWDLIQSTSTGFNRFWQKQDGSFWVCGKQLYKLNPAAVPVPASAEAPLSVPQHAMRVAPNPVTDRFSVQVDFTTHTLYHIYVIDQQGKRYRKIDAGKTRVGERSFDVNSADWAAGIYYVILETDASSNAVKVYKAE